MKNGKKIIFIALVCAICIAIYLYMKSADSRKIHENNSISEETKETENVEQIENKEPNAEVVEETSANTTEKQIQLQELDDKGKKYSFTYKNEVYNATYTTDNWHITDSYKITNIGDITRICQALIDTHPIHGKDMESYRTAEDMAYEWLQHNIAYRILPDDSKWKQSAKDVDLDPADQGRSIEEMYEARTGKKFNLNSIK